MSGEGEITASMSVGRGKGGENRNARSGKAASQIIAGFAEERFQAGEKTQKSQLKWLSLEEGSTGRKAGRRGERRDG